MYKDWTKRVKDLQSGRGGGEWRRGRGQCGSAKHIQAASYLLTIVVNPEMETKSFKLHIVSPIYKNIISYSDGWWHHPIPVSIPVLNQYYHRRLVTGGKCGINDKCGK